MIYWQSGGLQVDTSDTEEKSYRFEVDGHHAAVRLYWRQPHDGRSELELVFSLDSPLRFNVGVQVPAGCINACATLNGQLLIGYFSGHIPDDLPGAVTSDCQEHGAPVSTLRPGQVQNISFRWQDGDRLLFIWIWS